MKYTNLEGLHLYEFDSFAEYLDRAADPVYKNPQTYYHSGWPSLDWHQQLYYAKNGWADVIKDIDEWRNLVVTEISSRLPKPEIMYDKIGMFWDVGRVVEGDPDCWIYEEPTPEFDRPGKGNIVRFVINTASSCMVRTAFHTRRCGVILALAQLLERQGFFIQFEITTAIQVGYKKVEFRTVAKQASEVFNIAALAYWSSSYMEHRIDFAICETVPQCIRVSSKGDGSTKYGSPIGTHDGGDICFDRGHSGDCDWGNDKQAKDYIIKQLEKQGIVLDAPYK